MEEEEEGEEEARRLPVPPLLLLPRRATVGVVGFILGGDVAAWRLALANTPAPDWIWKFADV